MPFPLQRLLTCEGQELLSQGCTACGSAFHAVKHLLRDRAFRFPRQQFHSADDDGKQIVKVMRNTASELADGFQLLRLEQCFLGAFEGECRFPPFRNVAGDLGKAEQLAVVVVDRVDDDAGPETSAILAHPPPFGLEFPLFQRGLDRSRRDSCEAVFLSVKAGEMLADDFLFSVSLKALRTGVPTADVSLGGKHVDRVIGYSGNEDAELIHVSGVRLVVK